MTLQVETTTVSSTPGRVPGRPVVGHWQIEFVATEGASFNVHSAQGRFFDVVIVGKALPLFFIVGSQLQSVRRRVQRVRLNRAHLCATRAP